MPNSFKISRYVIWVKGNKDATIKEAAKHGIQLKESSMVYSHKWQVTRADVQPASYDKVGKWHYAHNPAPHMAFGWPTGKLLASRMNPTPVDLKLLQRYAPVVGITLPKTVKQKMKLRKELVKELRKAHKGV